MEEEEEEEEMVEGLFKANAVNQVVDLRVRPCYLGVGGGGRGRFGRDIVV